MAKGYLVAHIRVHDKEGFEKFKEMSGPVISESVSYTHLTLPTICSV